MIIGIRGVVRERLIEMIIGNVMDLRYMLTVEIHCISVNPKEGENAVTYFQAESMRQEFNTAVLYRTSFPERIQRSSKKIYLGSMGRLW